MRFLPIALILISSAATPAQATFDPLAAKPADSTLTQPTLSPQILFLFELERKFARATAEGGGKAFATFFAEDAITLSNKQNPVVGRQAIAEKANWDPKQYLLTWTPTGGSMGPSGDMGYTWGHYEGHAKDSHGNPIVQSGRYITLWKKQPNGEWKVVLDSSNEEAPNAGDCCALPKP